MTAGERRLVPWAFLVIIVATFISAIVVGLGLFPLADPGFFRWLIGAGIAEIVGAVLWAFRDSFQMKARPVVNLEFEGKLPVDLDLDAERCFCDLKERESFVVGKGGKVGIEVTERG